MSEETTDSEASIESSQVRNDFSEILDEFLDKYEIKGRKMLTKLDGETSTEQLEIIRQGLICDKKNTNDDSDDDDGNNGIDEKKSKNNTQRKKDIYIRVQSEEKYKNRQNWDCQS